MILQIFLLGVEMEALIHDLLVSLGEDPERSGLKDTPRRVATALEFLTSGKKMDVASVINGAIFPSSNSEMVIVKDIELYSLCEHHMLPFVGKCHIGYLPNGQVIGLSKLARIVDMFARRLQIQENLTKEIADCILEVTSAKGVGVIIEAEHMCMMMRGVQKQNAVTTTSVMLGLFRNNPSTRQEFLTLIK